MHKISHNIEQQYIDFFKKYYDITVESNDVLDDYTIMKNAKTLVCSMSTLSWCAALFSNNPQTVYFPEYKIYRIHKTFKKHLLKIQYTILSLHALLMIHNNF